MDPLVHLLAELTSNDDDRALRAVENLKEIEDEATSALFALLQNENADHRWWAIRALAAFEDDLSTSGLIQGLSDADVNVRQCAAIALRKKPSEKATKALVDAMHDHDRLLARLAGDALTAIGSKAILALTEALRAARSEVRGEAARALAKMENSKTIPILFSALDDPSSIVQYWVEEGLNKLNVGMLFFGP